MKEYPKVITTADLQRYAHITDDEVRRDILDTETEIAQYERVRKAESEIAEAHPDANVRRMADFKATARPLQIGERQDFVAFLRRLLDARAIADHGDRVNEMGPPR